MKHTFSELLYNYIEVISLTNKHSDKFKEISNNIKKLRKKNGMTQKELAERVGISISYLSKIEAANCNKSFSLHVLFDIAEALNVDIKELF